MHSIVLLFIAFITTVNCQTRDPRFYSREGVNWDWPNPGDPNYRTYSYNGRRYGHYQPNGYGVKYPGQMIPGQHVGPGGLLGGDKFNPFDPVSFKYRWFQFSTMHLFLEQPQ